MERKKILLGITKSSWGGATRYVFDLATNLPKNEFDVSVLAGGEGVLFSKLSESNIRHLKIPYIKRDVAVFDEIEALVDLLKIFRRERPDIMHLNSPKLGGLGALSGRLAGVKKIIYTVHGFTFFEDRPAWQKYLITFFTWITLLLSHKIIIINSRDLTAARKFPFCKNKIAFIPLGIADMNFLEKRQAQEKLSNNLKMTSDTLWIGSIAELHPNKNLTLAIRSVLELRRRGVDVCYTIIGEGEERSMLQKFIETNNANDFISLVGFKDNAAQYLKAFDIFLLTSKKEGLPYVLLEAALAHTYIVANDVGGVGDILKNPNLGIAIKNANVENLTDSLLKFIEKRLPDSAPEITPTNHFSIEPMIEKTVNLYQE